MLLFLLLVLLLMVTIISIIVLTLRPLISDHCWVLLVSDFKLLSFWFWFVFAFPSTLSLLFLVFFLLLFLIFLSLFKMLLRLFCCWVLLALLAVLSFALLVAVLSQAVLLVVLPVFLFCFGSFLSFSGPSFFFSAWGWQFCVQNGRWRWSQLWLPKLQGWRKTLHFLGLLVSTMESFSNETLQRLGGFKGCLQTTYQILGNCWVKIMAKVELKSWLRLS